MHSNNSRKRKERKRAEEKYAKSKQILFTLAFNLVIEKPKRNSDPVHFSPDFFHFFPLTSRLVSFLLVHFSASFVDLCDFVVCIE